MGIPYPNYIRGKFGATRGKFGATQQIYYSAKIPYVRWG
jgi:hypothetical protein